MGINEKVRIIIKRDQREKLAYLNPVLKLNELIAVYDKDVLVGHKIGDGVTKWSQLEYIQYFDDIDEFWVYDTHDGSIGKIVLNPKCDD